MQGGTDVKLYVVGIGPGGVEDMTLRAREVLSRCTVVAGYGPYLALISELLSGKRLLQTGMRSEERRCRLAIEAALSGEEVAVVSSGDAGVYGMAGLVLELCREYAPLTVEIVPGVTAALSGAALLGAPLTSDFAVISLSDLLTPWETIERRLRAAAAGDFSIALYNPGSHQRRDHLRRACGILLETIPEDRICGVARAVGREGQEVRLLTLKELSELEADMQMTVFIGSSATVRIQDRMVTPRGYLRISGT